MPERRFAFSAKHPRDFLHARFAFHLAGQARMGALVLINSFVTTGKASPAPPPATCGKCVMQSTWRPSAERMHFRADGVRDLAAPHSRRFRRTPAVRPVSCRASDNPPASMTREISPLEAIVRNGLSGSPGFGEKSSSSESVPLRPRLVVRRKLRFEFRLAETRDPTRLLAHVFGQLGRRLSPAFSVSTAG